MAQSHAFLLFVVCRGLSSQRCKGLPALHVSDPLLCCGVQLTYHLWTFFTYLYFRIFTGEPVRWIKIMYTEKKTIREWFPACHVGEEALGKLSVCQMGQDTEAYMGEFLKQCLVLIALMDYHESFYVCSLLVYHFSVDLSGFLSGSLVSSSSKIYRLYTYTFTSRYTNI